MIGPDRVKVIIAEEAASAGLEPADLTGERRDDKAYQARAKAMVRVRGLIFADGKPASLPRIGHWFGGRDHKTVWTAIRRAEAEFGA